MDADRLKRAAAEAALEFVPDGAVVGVGTGSTAGYFIAGLTRRRDRIAGAVASSLRSAGLLREAGIQVFDTNLIESIPVYVDGADEINPRFEMIKGGGGALTAEKIVASMARLFVCIADESKLVDSLGAFPLPIDVIPMAVGHVSREMKARGGRPELRRGFVTDNGNVIVDVHGLHITNPAELEADISQIAGVVTCGVFARRPADILLLAHPGGVEQRRRQV